MTLTKSEFKYIAYSVGFAVVYFMFILPWAINKYDGNSPMFQFMVFNIGTYVVFFIFLKSLTSGSSYSNATTTLGLLSMFLALDTWMPEYHVSMQGALISGANVGVGTTDYVLGLLGTNIGLSGVWVYLFTYVLAPAVLLYLSAKLIPDFVRKL